MKKLIRSVLILFVLMNLALSLQMAVANAQVEPTPLGNEADAEAQPSPEGYETLGEPSGEDSDIEIPDANFGIDPSTIIKEVGEGTGLQPFETGQHPDAPPDYIQPGVGQITSPIYFALDLFRYVISGVAMIIVIIAAIKLVSTGSEEEAKKAKETITMGVIGLLVIQVADYMVKRVFFGEQGEFFEDQATAGIYAEEGVELLRGIIGFVEIFVGAAAVLTIIVRGFVMIASGADEEAVTKSKRHILYAMGGIAVIGLSEIIVRGFIFPAAGTELPDTGVGRMLIIKVTNFLSGLIALFAFASLFYAGYKYVASAGNEEETEKVKKTFIGAVIALILALGAFALVNTVLDFPAATDLTT